MKQLFSDKLSLQGLQGVKLFPVILLFFSMGFSTALKAQVSMSTESMALGGGGTAYLTGYEALFANPANLFISEKNYSIQASFLQGAYYYDSILPAESNIDRLRNYYNRSTFFDAEDDRMVLDQNLREQIVERNFGEVRMSRVFTNQSEIYWFGLKWVRPKRSYALSLRTRYASQYELARGLYSNTAIEHDDTLIFDQSFQHRFEALHELSFGFAESFTYLNGLIPRLSEFIIGVAPKVVLSGGYVSADFTNRYTQNSGDEFWERNVQYSQQTAGAFSQDASLYFSAQNGVMPAGNRSFRELMQTTGVGLGLDIGITYLITFGDDLSVLHRQDDPTDQSLRISFSVTDLGAVYYYDDPVEIQINPDTYETRQTGGLLQTEYGGAPNEHYLLLEEYGDLLSSDIESRSQDNFSTLLPTSINAGALFQYRRVKMMGDLSYSVSESALSSKGLTSYLGMEIRPIRAIPLRTGTRLGAGLPGFFSVGAGLETKHFDLNAAIQLKSGSSGPTSEILAASLMGIKFYFQ